MKPKIELIMTVCLLITAFVLAKQGALFVLSSSATGANTGVGSDTNVENDTGMSSDTDVESDTEHAGSICIVIDAGHGGSDPGKVGINDALEKDINLALALKLQKLLEADGIKIVLTRDSDAGLYAEGSTNQKVEDMQNRCKIITEANPVFTVSLHQNSYPSEEVKGAQVFYYGQSVKGKALAETIQKNLIAEVDPENHREAKANESYYLLKKTPTPTVIVECGFLSNQEEADLLLTEDYQNQVVAAVRLGILEYLQTEGLL
jgi:N-acetylmuramoyl-L-alanine amidase